MIRRFQDRQIKEDELEQILQAGLYAPSAGNNQYSRIVVCQDKEINEKLGRINRYMQFKGNDKYAYEDAAMIGENIMLAAHFLDIGACYIGRTEEVFATE